MSIVIVSFIVVFVLILFAVTVGLKFLDARRKTQMVGMLQTAAGESVVTVTNLLKEIEPDKPTGFKQIVASLHFSKHAQEQITQAGLTWSANRLISMMAILGAAGFFLGLIIPGAASGPLTALGLAASLGSLPYVFVRRKRKKRLDTLEEQLPEALDFLARSMRAGHAFTISLEMIGEEVRDPLGQEFRALFNEQNLGAALETAMANFAMRVPLLDVRFFTSSVMLQKQTGGNLAEILQRLAYVIRERFKLKGQVKAASAHGKLTAGILTVLPVVTMLGLLIVAPGYLQGMAEDPDGKKMIGGAIVAQIIGNICIKKIINIKV
ncbi:MAG TPA: type II secretion system F family protein [Bryobacteraceae bacterium]|nr:type II secretion system F family protein [Bryobacteraceae bacterium]